MNDSTDSTPAERVFSRIYAEGSWGAASAAGDFHSGSGSHDPALTNPYIAAVGAFLSRLDARPDVVDLGCGDFAIGARLRPHCARYVACDVVPALIERNRRLFASLDVDFRCIDIVDGELPDGNVAILRQVLQHLGNAQIAALLPKLRKYRYLILTEHLPAVPTFIANVDQQTGAGIRLDVGSGVVLTAAPFLLSASGAERLCAVPQMGGRVETVVYTLDPQPPALRAATYRFEWTLPRPATRAVGEGGPAAAPPALVAAAVTAPPSPETAAGPEWLLSHRPGTPRSLCTRLDDPPRVLLAILAKQKEAVLPFYLQCIEALDYPKAAISVWIRTNNNTDRTAAILAEWADRVRPLYAQVELDDSDVAEPVQTFGVHEWNATRFTVLGRIRKESLRQATQAGCAFYFVADVDNFIRPCTLRELVALDLPIVAPLLRHEDPGRDYANFHAAVDVNGYYAASPLYHALLYRRIRGICEVPVVHCTYLVRCDVLPRLEYVDGSGRYEYVVFADSARRQGIPQYVDTRQNYGYLTLEESPVAAQALLGAEIGSPPARA